jgi:hypothetical protein
MRRRKLTFRHITPELAQAIRSVENYWPCESLRQLPYNSTLAAICEAAQEDASTAYCASQGLEEASQRLESKVYTIKNA